MVSARSVLLVAAAAVAALAAALVFWVAVAGTSPGLWAPGPVTRVTFVDDPAAVRRLLVQGADYFQRLNATDMRVRGCRSPADCLQKYVEGVQRFGAAEKGRLRRLARAADERIGSGARLPELARLRWRLCKVDRRIEGGYPHTHGDVIFLTSLTLEQADEEVVRTLVHEKCHVFQRVYPASVQDLYARFWGMERAVARSACEDCRSNPDLDGFWYRGPASVGGGPVCMQVYRAGASSLAHSDARLVPVGGARAQKFQAQKQFQAQGGTAGACPYEHPNEAMAYLLAELAVPTSGAPVDDSRLRAGLVAWLDSRSVIP